MRVAKSLRQLVEFAADAVVVAGRDGKVLLMNAAAERLFAVERAEVVGKPVERLVAEKRRDAVRRVMERYFVNPVPQSMGATGQVWVERVDGSKLPVDVSLNPMVIDGVLCVVAAIQDVSEKHELLEELRSANEKLVRQTAELERSNAELEQFAYVASHDLQEPLRMVTSYVELLARKYEDRLDEDANRFIHYAVDGANRMRTLILDLLEYSRIGRMDERHRDVDLEDVLADAIRNLLVAIRESDAEISHDPLPVVRGSHLRLCQLFQNLIGNAIKFRSEAHPRIHVGCEARAGEWAFTVSDNGIGFDAAHAERIFRPFQRLHDRSHSEGTGIGLALAARIVDSHGGWIQGRSVEGRGSTFEFALPRISEDAEKDPAERGGASGR